MEKSDLHFSGFGVKGTIIIKIWDDESFENIHFTKVLTEYTLKEVNELERVFLELLNYKLFITASEYAKYYFILRAYSEMQKKETFSIEPPKISLIARLQKGINKLESKLNNSNTSKPLEQTL